MHLLPSMYKWLAFTKREDAKILVVEGWLFDYMLRDAVQEFNSGKYDLLVITGCEKPNGFNYADRAYVKLTQYGVDPKYLKKAPGPVTSSEKTRCAANGLRTFLENSPPQIKTVNVFTGGPHARKTHLLFTRALGNNYKVGIIACKVHHFDEDHWWRSKIGIVVTIKFALGYLYYLIFRL